jgi:CBS domain-containing protein
MARTLKDVMTRDVEVVHPNDTLRECAEKMRSLNVGPMPVCEDGKLVGMITDRDIVVRAVALGHDPASTRVRDAMTDQVESCSQDTTLEEAAKLMQDKQIRRVLVLDENRKLAGIVALGDLSQDADDRLAGETLERISEPSAPSM